MPRGMQRMKGKAPSPRIRQVGMVIVLVLLGWFCISCSYRYDLVLAPSLLFKVLSALLLLIGLIIRILAFKEIRCTHRIEHLVTSGIYSTTRNPVYLALTFIIMAIAFFSRALLSLIWVFISVLVFCWVAKREEIDLEKAFGEEYLRYRKKVPMLLPRLWKGSTL